MTSKNFILALDLDGVCAKYTEGLARVVEKDRGLDPGSLPEPTSWDFANWGLHEKEAFMYYHEKMVVEGRGLASLQIMEGACDSLWRISDAGVWIRIVTHRLVLPGHHGVIAEDTVKWLEEVQIPYRDLCFLANKVAIEADLYVDDGPHNITALEEAGKTVITYSQPYNVGVGKNRVDNWQELEKVILSEYEAWKR